MLQLEKRLLIKKGNQTSVTQDSKAEIKDQIVTLGQVEREKVEFVPNPNSDEDGSFSNSKLVMEMKI